MLSWSSGPGSSSELLQASKRIKIGEVDERREHAQVIQGLPDYPVDLDRRARDAEQKLKEARVLGIVGVGGIGKTAIAKKLFNNISREYQYTCFVHTAKGMKDGVYSWILTHLHHHGNAVSGVEWCHLKDKKTLIVVDDEYSEMDSRSTWRYLAESLNLGNGSHLIITSQDVGFFNVAANCVSYEVDLLEFDEAQKLLCLHTFGQERIPDLFLKSNSHLKKDVERAVEACGGLPITLEVVGCYLKSHQTNMVIWKETIEILRDAKATGGDLNDIVRASFKVSYDALSPEEQLMFIESGTYFLGDSLERALVAWNNAYGFSETRWKTLLSRSLVKEVKETFYSTTSHMQTECTRVWMNEQLSAIAKSLATGIIISTDHEETWKTLRQITNSNQIKEDARVLQLCCRRNCSGRCELVSLELHLLNQLQGLKYLDMAFVRTYGSGENFPSKLSLLRWIGAFSRFGKPFPIGFQELSNLSILELSDRELSKESIEGLSCLKKVHILSFGQLKGLDDLPKTFGLLSQLRQLELRGLTLLTLPDSFCNLSQLRHLELVDLPLSALPNSFGMLSALEHLALCNVGISELPSSFGDLSSLVTLAIIGCNQLASLPSSFCHLSSLKQLTIFDCPLLKCPSQSLFQLSSLEQLQLHDISLEDTGDSIGNLSSLQNLSLEGRSCASLERLPPGFELLCSLATLELKGCNHLRAMPHDFGQLVALQVLTMSEAHSLEKLPDSFGQLVALKELTIRGAPCLERLPENFGNLSVLTWLRLEECSSLEKLPASFGLLSSLHTLVLEGCYELRSLPDNFHQLVGLRYLAINGADLLEDLPDKFGHLSALEHFSLEGCGQLRSGLRGLPESFGQLKALKTMTISGGLEELPNSFGNLSALKVLDLIECPSLKSLPTSFGLLSALEELDLPRCSQLQRLPGTFGHLHSLERLSVSCANHLEALSDSFQNFSKLKHLELYFNMAELNTSVESPPECLFRHHSSLKSVFSSSICSEVVKALPDFFEKIFPPAPASPHGDGSTEQGVWLLVHEWAFPIPALCPLLDLGWVRTDLDHDSQAYCDRRGYHWSQGYRRKQAGDLEKKEDDTNNLKLESSTGKTSGSSNIHPEFSLSKLLYYNAMVHD